MHSGDIIVEKLTHRRTPKLRDEQLRTTTRTTRSLNAYLANSRRRHTKA